MKKNQSSRPFSVLFLIFLLVFLGVQALFGGGLFLLSPDGSLLGMPLSYLENTPFSNFFIPGLLLFTFVGVFPLADAYSLWAKPAWRWPQALNPFKRLHWSWAGSLASGVAALIWIAVQVQWIPVGFLHIFIFSWGLVTLIITFAPQVRAYCRV